MRLAINPVNIAEESIYLDLAGELVLGDDSTGKLRRTLDAYIELEYSSVYVDMAGVTKIDAAGIGTLVSAYAAGAKRGTRIQLCNLTNRAIQLLAVTKLLSVFGPESCQTIAA